MLKVVGDELAHGPQSRILEVNRKSARQVMGGEVDRVDPQPGEWELVTLADPHCTESKVVSPQIMIPWN